MAFVTGHDQGSGIQRTRLPVKDGDSGTGNKTISLTECARDIVISNDSTTLDLTLKVSGAQGDFTFVLKPGELIDERFPSFSEIEITAGGAWRCYWRSGVLV